MVELQNYLKPLDSQGPVQAHPGVGTAVPVYILGSSTSSAQLAASLGLPYVFAAHFAPQQLEQALQIYRNGFKPSEYLAEPYVMVCVNVVAADSNAEAEKLATSSDQFYLNVVRGSKNLLQPPLDTMDGQWSYREEMMVRGMSQYTFKGDEQTISEQLGKFVAQLQVDEVIAVSYIYDQEKRKRSFEVLKQAANRLHVPTV